MKKRYVNFPDEMVTDTPTRFCGFIDTSGEKGYLVHIGSGQLKAVGGVGYAGWDVPNVSYGTVEANIFHSVEEFCNKNLSNTADTAEIIYMFDSMNELFLWLAGDEE